MSDEAGVLDFELGPIRPPSEAGSLLIRVTRNCPWNRCTFCPVYKGARFALRPRGEVLRDIEAARRIAEEIRLISWREGLGGRLDPALARRLWGAPGASDGFRNVVQFLLDGGRSVFLQDGNTLVVPPRDLVPIVAAIRKGFPHLERITTYARSHTAAHRKPADLRRLREAGLSRIHIGLETAYDPLLAWIRKGATAAQHLEAGLRIKEAGFELSEYVMPGLGGRRWWREHAQATAEVLSRIDPHFIRLRTLAVPSHTPLGEAWRSGEFQRLDDEEILREIELFIQKLEGFTGMLQSDHILNLLPGIEGRFPAAREPILRRIREFLALPREERETFIAGRRLGILAAPADLHDPHRRRIAEHAAHRLRQHPRGFQAGLWDLMQQFI